MITEKDGFVFTLAEKSPPNINERACGELYFDLKLNTYFICS